MTWQKQGPSIAMFAFAGVTPSDSRGTRPDGVAQTRLSGKSVSAR